MFDLYCAELDTRSSLYISYGFVTHNHNKLGKLTPPVHIRFSLKYSILETLGKEYFTIHRFFNFMIRLMEYLEF